MDCAPMAHTLWSLEMKYDPKDPKWLNRDRFILSNGHACALQYSMLHLTGYDLTLDDLQHFRQFGSKTPGHPEVTVTPGVECVTGPLGQGIANAVGMAMAERHLAAEFNEPGFNIIDHYTYVICGDGCLQEGVAQEAISLAGTQHLGKLILLYDSNNISIDGNVDLAFTENIVSKFHAMNWTTLEISQGDYNTKGIQNAIKFAQSVQDAPTLIKINTTIGIGTACAGTAECHGNPLTPHTALEAKVTLGIENPDKSFEIPEDVKNYYLNAGKKAAEQHKKWNEMLEKYKEKYPKKYSELMRRMNKELPEGWDTHFPTFTKEVKKATRQLSGSILNSLIDPLPELFGGSADLTSSTCIPAFLHDFSQHTPNGRLIHFGVREHGMAAICNGIASHGSLLPFCSTFFSFMQYCLPSIRLAALSHFHVLFIFTHDSIGLGEDGPTHQPVEQLCQVRSIPHLLVIRPADGNETIGAYKCYLEMKDKPTLLVLSRQSVNTLDNSSIDNVKKGGYIIYETKADVKPDLILIGTGTEVGLAIDAAKSLELNVRVVSMPSMCLFEEQSIEYRNEILPCNIPIVSIEAAGHFGWERYSHYHIGMDDYGASAPAKVLYEKFGFSVDSIKEKCMKVYNMLKGKELLRPIEL